MLRQELLVRAVFALVVKAVTLTKMQPELTAGQARSRWCWGHSLRQLHYGARPTWVIAAARYRGVRRLRIWARSQDVLIGAMLI